MNKLMKSAHLIISLCLMVGLSGCENGNLFGKVHKTGESNDVRTLSAEAQDAYRSQDYARAVELWNRVLAQNPNSAKALYGAAAAAIAASGFNATTVANNVLNQSNATFITSMGEMIQGSRESIYPSSQVASNSVLNGIDLAALDAVIDPAICHLQKIASGGSDNEITPNNLDLLVNYGLLLLIRAVLKPVRRDLIDLVNVNGEYTVVVDPALTTGVCDGSQLLSGFGSISQQQAFLSQVAKDLAGGYAVYNRAVQNSSLGSNSAIARLRDDLAEANEQFLAVSGDLPAACLAVFSSEGIDVNNFTSYTGPFAPPTGC